MLLAILVYLIKNNMMKPAYYSDFDAVNEKCGKSNCCNRHDEYSGMKPEFYDGIWKVTDRLIELIYYRFDICQWSSRNTKLTEKQLIRLKKIVEYMFLHCNETITLKDVAEVIDVTEGYVSNLLSKYAIGFYNIVTYIRSWKAERMLLSTNMSITETAAECHFSSTKYMYAAFDYWYKCKPNEFRKKYRSEMKKKNIETVIAVNDVQQLVDELVNKQLISMYMEDDDLYG